MGRCVRTISGDVPVNRLGRVMPHEHGFLPMNREPPDRQKKLLPRIERRLIREFGILGREGLNMFVDVSTAQNPRHPGMWRRASETTGMNVLLSTGFYVEETLPEWLRKAGVESIAAFMHQDVSGGIEGTDVRAGVIKVSGNSYGVEAGERKVFLAAAETHRVTGVPITTHSPKGALPHLRLLEREGVEPERVSLGHIEVNPWEDVLAAARKGSMLIFTNWGGREWVPEDMITAQVRDLVRRGYSGQILLSVDMYLYLRKGRLTYRWPGGYAQLLNRVPSKLVKNGLKPAQVERILRDNPLKHLAFETS